MLQKELAINSKFIALKFKIYYDKKQFEEIDFKIGEKISVLRKNMKITKENNKLDHVKIEFFKILKNIKGISYKLKLSTNMKKKHSVFHISLLKSAHPDTSETSISENYI